MTVVTNRCTDDTKAVALRMGGAGLSIRVVDAPLRSSAGYAKRGAANTDADYILFCDADDVVGSTWVAEMYRRCALDGFDVVGGQITVDTSALARWLADTVRPSFDGDCSLPMATTGTPLRHQWAVGTMPSRRWGALTKPWRGQAVKTPILASGPHWRDFPSARPRSATVRYRLPSTVRGLIARTYRVLLQR